MKVISVMVKLNFSIITWIPQNSFKYETFINIENSSLILCNYYFLLKTVKHNSIYFEICIL